MPVEVIDTIKPANGNTFPVADVVDLKGVDQNFADVAERDAFDAEKLAVGQRARTRADSKTWEVASLAPVVWTEVAAGGGAVSSVAGRTGDVVLSSTDIGGVSSGVLLGRHEAGTGNAQHVSLASTFVLQGSTLTLVDASIGTSKLGGDITAAGKAILDDVDAVGIETERDVDFGMLHGEVAQCGQHELAPQKGTGGDLQASAWRALTHVQFALGLLQVAHHFVRVVVQHFAFAGERQGTGSAVEQAHAQAQLQSLDGFADRRSG